MNLSRVFGIGAGLALVACSSAASPHGAPSTERAGSACEADGSYRPPYPQQLYAATAIAVVEGRVDCGNGDHRLLLRATSGNVHGSFVGHVVSMTKPDGGAWDPGRDAQSREAIDRAKVGDRVEVEMGMYPGLNSDGTLAHPGSLEWIRTVEAPPPSTR